MSAKVYENGAWRDVKGARVFENGAWRDVKQGNIYENGAWRKVYPELAVDVAAVADGFVGCVDSTGLTGCCAADCCAVSSF